jgi:hypothetical protein
MNYEIFYEPVAHIIVDDVFDDNEYNELFNSIQKVENDMTPGTLTETKYFTQQQSKIYNSFIKRNFNFWPTEHNDEDSNKIVSIVKNKIFSLAMRKVYVSVKDSMFQYFHFANRGSILVSKYTQGSFYDWHYDLSGSITSNMLLSKDNVIGGNFLLKNVHGKIKEVKFKNNRCILFPALCSHKVTEVINDCNRYSIQCFSSINLENGVKDE